jgi:hypothetical protein
MLLAAVAAAATIWVTTAWLLGVADKATTATDRARVRVDAVRTGLAAGAGAGAAVTLMLAFRRQAHQEYDTAERRITELYNAAAEQLGSDKAPVRLTALYTLERLANDNPLHQQTIVNIICAYLRMPYTPPQDYDGAADRTQGTARVNKRRYQAARRGRQLIPEPVPAEPDPHEERQVRVTAQRLLTTHLDRAAKASGTHWRGITLDLRGATLLDFDLLRCELATADFSNATFSGFADFGFATFSDRADFSNATFSSIADFRFTTFSSIANFRFTTFSGSADFGFATFSRRAGLKDARVIDVTRRHIWPPGWTVERTEGEAGKLVWHGQTSEREERSRATRAHPDRAP